MVSDAGKALRDITTINASLAVGHSVSRRTWTCGSKNRLISTTYFTMLCPSMRHAFQPQNPQPGFSPYFWTNMRTEVLASQKHDQASIDIYIIYAPRSIYINLYCICRICTDLESFHITGQDFALSHWIAFWPLRSQWKKCCKVL